MQAGVRHSLISCKVNASNLLASPENVCTVLSRCNRLRNCFAITSLARARSETRVRAMSHAQSSGVQAELITNGLDLLTLDDRSRQPVKTNKTSSKTSNGGKDGPSKQKQQSREVQHNKPSKKQKDKQSLPASVKQTKGGRPHVQQPPPPPHQGPNVTTRSQARKDQLASKHSRMSDDPKQFLLPVPKPDEDYEDQAMNMPVPIKYAKKLLIILDLNGTLVHRKSKRQNSSFTQRLRCKDFLQYVSVHSHVL